MGRASRKRCSRQIPRHRQAPKRASPPIHVFLFRLQLFHAPKAYTHVSGLCSAARFLAEMRRYRTLCVLLRLPKKSFGPPCENAFPGAVLLPAPESLFYMLSTGLRHSFNNILYISALQTTMSCGIVHHAAQEAVVATADMHQRRRLSHCTQKAATRKAGGQGAGDNHQGERK